MIRRDAAADSRLSWKARGLLAYLLSLPDGWDIAVRDLVHRGPDGRDAVYTVLHGLKACGYLTEENRAAPHPQAHREPVLRDVGIAAHPCL